MAEIWPKINARVAPDLGIGVVGQGPIMVDDNATIMSGAGGGGGGGGGGPGGAGINSMGTVSSGVGFSTKTNEFENMIHIHLDTFNEILQMITDIKTTADDSWLSPSQTKEILEKVEKISGLLVVKV